MNNYGQKPTSASSIISHTKKVFRLLAIFALAIPAMLVFLWGIGVRPTPVHAAGNILYVSPGGSDGGGANLCTSSNNPCLTIQHAINQATTNDTIKVAQGTYLENLTIGTGGIVLSGGYTSTNWINAAPNAQPTIIDGNASGRVIEANSASNITIEGFYITNGQTTVGDDTNQTESGAGIYLGGISATIRNNHIYANNTYRRGGAIYVDQFSQITVEYNQIYNNTATGHSSAAGGAIAYEGSSSSTVQFNHIYSNTVSGTFGTGGAIINVFGSLFLQGNIVHNNQANAAGGGVYNELGSVSVVLENNILYANTAEQGGGIFSAGDTFTLWNNTIVSNTAAITGGGIYIWNAPVTAELHNTILLNNSVAGTPNGLVNDAITSTVNASYNSILDPVIGLINRSNQVDTPPAFVNAAGNDFHILPAAAQVDAGDPGSVITTDVDGEARPFGDEVDIGADETYLAGGTCFARVNDGEIYTDLQTAINAAATDDTVKVAGYCTGSGSEVALITKTITVRGGYTLTNWTEPSPAGAPTTLDGEGNRRVVYVSGGDSVAPTLDGFLITGGSAFTGAGIYIDRAAEPIVQNNIIVDNITQGGGVGGSGGLGGGIANEGGNPVLQHNTIYNNTATASGGGGGGIYNNNGSPLIENNLIIENAGGGIANNIGVPIAQYNDVYNNTGGNYIGLAEGNNSLSVDPLFEDKNNNDFHLKQTSPVIGQANPSPANPPETDFEGDSRPQGQRSDMGADEAAVFPGIEFTPNVSFRSNPTSTSSIDLVHTHVLKNAGSINDVFDIVYSTSNGWTTQLSTNSVSLGIDQEVTILITVTIPANAPTCSIARTSITATSQANGNVFATALDTTKVRVDPLATFVPNITENIDPGNTVVLQHSLTNLAGCEDVYELTMDNPSSPTGIAGWLISPDTGDPINSYQVTIADGAAINVSAAFSMPATAEENLQDSFHIIATSQEEGVTYQVEVTDTVIANAISGDRFVSTSGNDTINNCAVKDEPCRTIKKGVETVSVGNTVHVAQGTYNETNIRLNGTIQLQGGWSTDFEERSGDARLTVIDAGGQDRALWILSNNPTIQGFTIQNGSSSARGGGLYIDGASSPIVQGNIFAANTSSMEGGGIAIENGNPVIQNNAIYNNSATSGGGIYLGNGNAQFINNTIVNNSASVNGGGVYNSAGSASLDNTIVTGNSAGNRGGGVYNGGGSISMNYNDFYNNNAVNGNNDSNVSIGGASLTIDPQLVDPAGLDFHLQADSPLIDVGDPATSNVIDFEDDIRPVNQGFDIGADEVAGCLAQIASTEEIFGVVQDAVDAAPDDDTVRISGVCRGVHPISINGQTIFQTVHLTRPVNLSGGWRQDFSKQDQPNAILDAELMGRTLFISGSFEINIDLLTFTSGDASGLGGGPNGEDAGGAVYIYAGNDAPIFTSNVFSGSVATIGGGVYNHSGNPIFTKGEDWSVTRIISNTASFRGGGFYNHAGDPEIENTVIAGNTATFDGGGFYNESGQPKFDGNQNYILNNFAGQNGGGFYNAAGNPIFDADDISENSAGNGGGFYNASTLPFTITNMILAKNNVTGNGGGFYNVLGSPTLWHITIPNNSAGGNGGGFYNQAGAPAIANTILFENSAAQGGGIYVAAGGPQLRYNDVFGNTGGDYSGISAGLNSISADPLFDPLHPFGGDYHLSEDSPAIDAGDPLNFVTTDFDAEIRPSNQGWDIGADELGGCLAQLNDGPTIYGNIMDAVRASTSFTDVVKVAGICRGTHTIDVGGQTFSQTVSLTKSLTLQGGWNTNPPFDKQNAVTILDAGNNGHVIYIGGQVQAVIEKFDIIRGLDGAVYNVSTSTTRLKQSNIYSSTGANGAAIVNNGGNLVVEAGNRIYNNTATNGAAFYSNGGTPALQNNFIYNNTAANGGGVYIANGNATVWHNTLIGNTATGGNGSGVYRAGGSPDIRGNIVMDGSGTGMHSSGGSGTVGYNNVVDNSGGDGNLTGSGDIHLTPSFVDKLNLDYHLTQDSAGLNVGDRSLFGLLTVDFEGDIRPSHQSMDIGADEVAPYEIAEFPQFGAFPGCFARINGNPPIYGSAQYAVDLASQGDTVDVAGLCRGVNSLGGDTQNLYLDKKINLRGGWRPDFTARDSFTILYPEDLGKGIYLDAGSDDSTIDRFRLSSAVGGAIYNNGITATIKNNLLYLNTSLSNGAGIYNAGGDTAIWNNTFFDNTAATNGAGVYVAADNPTIRNNIFDSNTAADGAAIYGSADIAYNNVWDNTNTSGNDYGGGAGGGTGSAITDSLFITDLPYGEGFMKLSSISPMRNAGDPLTLGTVDDDFEDQPRPSDLNYDIGADEYAACLAKVVETGAVYGQIQQAIDIISATTIYVHGYCRLLNNQTEVAHVGKDINFSGGWDEKFQEFETDYAVLDGLDAGRVLIVEPSVNVSFSGFAFFNGWTDTIGGAVLNNGTLDLNNPMLVMNSQAVNGGGIYNTSTGDLGLNTFGGSLGVISNTAASQGGGVYNAFGGTVDLFGGGFIEVDGNQAADGGGIYNAGTLGGSGIEGISYNRAITGSGGGIYNAGTITQFTNGVMERNTAKNDGGGLYNTGGATVDMENIFFFKNIAETGSGGGFYNNGSNLTLLHLTIRENESNTTGGGIYNTGGSLILSNTIVYSNKVASGNGGLHITGSGSSAVDWSNFYNNSAPQSNVSTGPNSVSLPPKLNDDAPYPGTPPLFPFSIAFVPHVTSPVIDAGDPSTGIFFDCCGNGRPHNAGFDQGIIEIKLQRIPDLEHILDTSVPGDTPDGVHTKYADPGATAVFSHTLTNRGSVTDTFDIAIASNTQPWTVTLMTTPTVTLAPFDFVSVVVSVTVPSNALAQVTNDTVLTATSQESRKDNAFGHGAEIETDAVTDRTIVNTLIKFEISDNEGYGAPNDVMPYTHVITNLSNITDSQTVNLFMNPQYADMQLVGPSLITVPRLTSATINVDLTIPNWLAGGIDDSSQVIIRPQNYPAFETAGVDTTHISYTTGIRYISLNGNDGDNSPDETVRWNNCTNPQVAPCRSITHTLSQAAPNDLIKLAAGTYNNLMTATVGSTVTNQIAFLDQSQTLMGGFTATDWENSQPLLNQTIFDAGSAGRGVFITGTVAVTIDGIHITGGSAITGGGIYNDAGDLTLLANAIHSNAADAGAGIFHQTGVLTMFNNTVYNNIDGGLHIVGGQATVEYNTFYQNETATGGGGRAKSDGNGGAIYVDNAQLTARNNIFMGNTASASGGAIYAGAGSTGVIDTNLFHVNNSDVFGPISNDNPVSGDPLFEDPGNDNFHIQKGSPAEDAALSIALADDFERDIRPQIAPNAYDIGADERLHIQGVEVEPNNVTLNAGFNQVITYTHTITNTGEDTDVFTVTAASSLGWADLSGFPFTVTLVSSGTTEISVTVTTGSTGSGGLSDITVISATSKLGLEFAGKLIFDTAVNTTTVAQNHSLSFTPDRSSIAFPGQTITYAHTLQNTGDGPDTFNFAAVSSHGWTTGAPNNITLPALSATTVIASMDIPFGTEGQVDTMLVTATSTISPAASATVTNTTTITGSGGPVSGVSLEPDNARSLLAGGTAFYTHTLTNTGDSFDSFTLSSSSSQSWTVTLLPAGPVALNGGQSTELTVQIDIPVSATVGAVDVTTITAVSGLNAAISDNAVNTTTITDTQIAGVQLTPDNAKASLAGETVLYQHTLLNNGNGPDSFTLSAASSQGWAITVTPSTTAQLGAGETTQIDVSITIPGGTAVDTVDVATVTAVSVFDPGVSDRAVNTTTVTDVRTVALSLIPNNLAVGSPNDTIDYAHTLTNDGSGTDSFNLSAVSSLGWTVSSTPLSVTLGPGATSPVTVSVTIPGSATDGMQDETTVTAGSVFSPAITASAVDTTTVTVSGGVTAAVTLEPDNSFTVLAGETVYYTHTLTNDGTDTDTFTLSSVSSQGWGVNLTPGAPVQLNAAQSAQIEVAITVPGGTPAGTVDNTAVTARSGLDSGVSDSATNTTTITDVVSAGVRLAPDNTAQGLPGGSVEHQHTLTNLGNGTDSFTLTWTSNTTWPVTTLPQTVSLSPNQSGAVSVTVIIPTGAPNGDSTITLITATSSLGKSIFTGTLPLIFDTATDVTTAWQPIIYLPLILKNYTPPTPTPTATSPGATNTPTATSPAPTDTPTATATSPGATNTPTATSPAPTNTPAATATPPNGPDLIITGISYNSGANEATITVMNQGNQNATDWFWVEVYVDRAPTGINDPGNAYNSLPSLAVGASANVVIPLTLSAGAHQLYGQVDTYDGGNGSPVFGKIQERNEDNNVFGPVDVVAAKLPEVKGTATSEQVGR